MRWSRSRRVAAADLDRLLGTKANDLQALRSELQGEGGWNTAKLGTVHGAPAADELVGSVDRNLKFRDTYNKVVENSQTAQREAAAREMKPEPSSETALINPNMSVTGLLATGAKKTANAALNAIRPDPTRSYGEAAQASTEQGAARDKRILAIVDALNGRQANAAAAPRVGDTAALLSAIAANSHAEPVPSVTSSDHKGDRHNAEDHEAGPFHRVRERPERPA